MHRHSLHADIFFENARQCDQVLSCIRPPDAALRRAESQLGNARTKSNSPKRAHGPSVKCTGVLHPFCSLNRPCSRRTDPACRTRQPPHLCIRNSVARAAEPWTGLRRHRHGRHGALPHRPCGSFRSPFQETVGAWRGRTGQYGGNPGLTGGQHADDNGRRRTQASVPDQGKGASRRRR